jgi:ribosomal protein S12 methylthiotransferase accessory factor
VGLRSKQTQLVPFDLVRLSHTAEEDGEPAIFKTSSTGLASGNTLDEATLHALFEILERDVLSDLTEFGADNRIIVDLHHLTEPTLVGLVHRLQTAGVDLELSMVPNRYGIPTSTAHIWSPQFPETCAGSGAHLDPVIAATRAITEAIQTRLTCISGMRDDLPSMVTAFDGYRTPPTFQQHGASWGAAVDAFAHAPSPDIASAVDSVADVLGEQNGWEPVVVDLSTRREDFSVVRVVAPGARFTARGYVPR